MTSLQKFNVYCPGLLLVVYIACFLFPGPVHFPWHLGVLVINGSIHTVFSVISPSEKMDKLFLFLAILLIIAILGFAGFAVMIGGLGGGLFFMGSPLFLIPLFSLINLLEGIGWLIYRLKASS